jgi:hypothetical protein
MRRTVDRRPASAATERLTVMWQRRRTLRRARSVIGTVPVVTTVSDTSPQAHAAQVERWRRMSPAEKMAEVDALSSAALRMAEAGVRLRHPSAGEHEVARRLTALCIGRDLSVAAFGWDPDIEGW